MALSITQPLDKFPDFWGLTQIQKQIALIIDEVSRKDSFYKWASNEEMTTWLLSKVLEIDKLYQNEINAWKNLLTGENPKIRVFDT